MSIEVNEAAHFEVIRKPAGSTFRWAVFDFDGTLSLIREGWPDVMIPMMMEKLEALNSGESTQDLRKIVDDDVTRLTGKQTIYQMIQFAERIEERGGKAEEPLVYKNEYHDRLMARIHDRRDALMRGERQPDDFLVKGGRAMLQALQARGLTLCLASGTDEKYVVEEAEMLDVTKFFGQHIYGAQDDYKTFSKKMVIERILRENQISGDQLVGFGDGYVEIENMHEAGGYAVGLATDESNGGLDKWKRERLIGAGADVIVPDFAQTSRIEELLFGENAA